jgi:hypothetical protein
MKLILYDNPERSFHYVYGAVLEGTGHLPIQAEQCILIAKNVGQCTLKNGDIDTLLEMKNILEKRKLKVEIV